MQHFKQVHPRGEWKLLTRAQPFKVAHHENVSTVLYFKIVQFNHKSTHT